MNKPLVIYHANCADGFGAAFAAWLKLGDEAEYVPMQYGKLGHTMLNNALWLQPGDIAINGRDVYILDFSLPRPVMDLVFANAKRVVWLDHHKTAFEMWCGGIPSSQQSITIDEIDGQEVLHTHLDNNKSGAMLAWEYFHPGTEVPMLIRHIDDYDRWKFQIDGTKAFNKTLWSYAPWSFEQWKREFNALGIANTWRQDLPTVASYVQEGEAILRAHDQNVQSVVKGSARECCIAEVDFDEEPAWGVGPFPGLAANCPPHLTSDVGHELATKSGTFGLCWTLSQTDLVAKCSLRSNGDYDVSAIAKSFGGGGHRNAAGFEAPIDMLLGWLK